MKQPKILWTLQEFTITSYGLYVITRHDPAQAAGIELNLGNNRWMSMIEQTVES